MANKKTDYDKFKAAMKMLAENGVVDKVVEDYVGINNDIIVSIFKSEENDVAWLTVVFDSDGNFDHEN